MHATRKNVTDAGALNPIDFVSLFYMESHQFDQQIQPYSQTHGSGTDFMYDRQIDVLQMQHQAQGFPSHWKLQAAAEGVNASTN